MNRLLFLLSVFVSLSISGFVSAVDIPSYIEDAQKVNENIEIILQNNESRSDDTQSAINSSEERKALLREYSSRLYADALAIRAQIVGTEKFASSSLNIGDSGNQVLDELSGQMGDELGGIISGLGKTLLSKLESKNKTSVLQNELKEPNKNIALRLKQIVELETAIANLQATKMLHAIDYSTDKGKQ